MAAAPLADPLHRRPVGDSLAAVDQHAADRAVRVTVLVGVAHAHHAALGERDAARALDLQEEGLDRILDVAEHLVADRRRPLSMSARDQ